MPIHTLSEDGRAVALYTPGHHNAARFLAECVRCYRQAKSFGAYGRAPCDPTACSRDDVELAWLLTTTAGWLLESDGGGDPPGAPVTVIRLPLLPPDREAGRADSPAAEPPAGEISRGTPGGPDDHTRRPEAPRPEETTP